MDMFLNLDISQRVINRRDLMKNGKLGGKKTFFQPTDPILLFKIT